MMHPVLCLTTIGQFMMPFLSNVFPCHYQVQTILQQGRAGSSKATVGASKGLKTLQEELAEGGVEGAGGGEVWRLWVCGRGPDQGVL